MYGCLFLLFLRAMDEGEELLAQVMQEVLQEQLWSIGWPQVVKKHWAFLVSCKDRIDRAGGQNEKHCQHM